MSSKEDYQWYKAHHICVSCHQQDAFKGQVLCLDCRDKWTERNRLRKEKELREETPEHRAHRLQKQKERRLRLISQGICVACGKRHALPNRQLCMECNVKRKRVNRESKERAKANDKSRSLSRTDTQSASSRV
jgi:hypothetical protein